MISTSRIVIPRSDGFTITAVMKKTTFDTYPAVVPRVSGTAYIVGRNELLIDPGDPLGMGFLLR